VKTALRRFRPDFSLTFLLLTHGRYGFITVGQEMLMSKFKRNDLVTLPDWWQAPIGNVVKTETIDYGAGRRLVKVQVVWLTSGKKHQMHPRRSGAIQRDAPILGKTAMIDERNLVLVSDSICNSKD
jgi:hypothetical protein